MEHFSEYNKFFNKENHNTLCLFIKLNLDVTTNTYLFVSDLTSDSLLSLKLKKGPHLY